MTDAVRRSMNRGVARNDGGVRTAARNDGGVRTAARNLRRIEDGFLGGGRLAPTASGDADVNPFHEILSPQGDRDGVRSPKGAFVKIPASSECE